MAAVLSPGRINFSTAADEFTEKKVRVIAVNWTGAADTNVLLLDDQDGNEIVGGKAETGRLERFWYFGDQGIPADQLILTTMTAGRLTVYIK